MLMFHVWSTYNVFNGLMKIKYRWLLRRNQQIFALNCYFFFSKRETDIKSIWKISRYKINLKPSVNIYYGFVLQERIFQNNIASMAKWREVHINDSMFIEDLLKWRQWHSINIITHRNQRSCLHHVCCLINTHYIYSVVVQDFVSGRARRVNQYHYESR